MITRAPVTNCVFPPKRMLARMLWRLPVSFAGSRGSANRIGTCSPSVRIFASALTAGLSGFVTSRSWTTSSASGGSATFSR